MCPLSLILEKEGYACEKIALEILNKNLNSSNALFWAIRPINIALNQNLRTCQIVAKFLFKQVEYSENLLNDFSFIYTLIEIISYPNISSAYCLQNQFLEQLFDYAIKPETANKLTLLFVIFKSLFSSIYDGNELQHTPMQSNEDLYEDTKLKTIIPDYSGIRTIEGFVMVSRTNMRISTSLEMIPQIHSIGNKYIPWGSIYDSIQNICNQNMESKSLPFYFKMKNMDLYNRLVKYIQTVQASDLNSTEKDQFMELNENIARANDIVSSIFEKKNQPTNSTQGKKESKENILQEPNTISLPNVYEDLEKFKTTYTELKDELSKIESDTEMQKQIANANRIIDVFQNQRKLNESPRFSDFEETNRKLICRRKCSNQILKNNKFLISLFTSLKMLSPPIGDDFKSRNSSNIYDITLCHISSYKLHHGIFTPAQITSSSSKILIKYTNLEKQNICISVSSIYFILPREYGFELFLKNGKSYLIHFKDLSQKVEFLKSISGSEYKAKLLEEIMKSNNQISKNQSNNQIIEAWIEGFISNFDFLLLLNIVTGHSFHDIDHYPIFPCLKIVPDQSSINVDFNDKAEYEKFDPSHMIPGFYFEEIDQNPNDVEVNAKIKFEFEKAISTRQFIESEQFIQKLCKTPYNLFEQNEWDDIVSKKITFLGNHPHFHNNIDLVLQNEERKSIFILFGCRTDHCTMHLYDSNEKVYRFAIPRNGNNYLFGWTEENKKCLVDELFDINIKYSFSIHENHFSLIPISFNNITSIHRSEYHVVFICNRSSIIVKDLFEETKNVQSRLLEIKQIDESVFNDNSDRPNSIEILDGYIIDCQLNESFNLIAILTSTGLLNLYSLNKLQFLRSIKIRIFNPRKVLITPIYGMILVYCDKLLLAYTNNGILIEKVAFKYNIINWKCFSVNGCEYVICQKKTKRICIFNANELSAIDQQNVSLDLIQPIADVIFVDYFQSMKSIVIIPQNLDIQCIPFNSIFPKKKEKMQMK